MKILFIQNRVLFPANTGGRIRTLNILKHLAGWHEVTYLCNAQPEDEEYFPQMRALGVQLEAVLRRALPWGGPRFLAALAANLFSPWPFNIAKHFDPTVAHRAASLVRERGFDLVVCDFLQTALHGEHLRGVPRLLFQHNVEAEILRRHAKRSHGWLRRLYFGLQWKRMARFEADMGWRFDAVVAVSPTDRTLFEAAYGWPHVATIDTGVDTDYFRPLPRAEQANRVLFLGSMDWMPNQDGVMEFVRHTWPLIRRQHPQATFQIVGRNPPAEILRLGQIEGIEVTGTVLDIRPYLGAATVMVVPLRIGGGTRLKIFEAMAMGKPVVSTRVGCEGLPVVPDLHLLVRDAGEPFAQGVCDLLTSPEQRVTMGRAARGLVEKRYGTERIARQFERICHDTVTRHQFANLAAAPAFATSSRGVLP
jgi:glycosyltransferase involved in cell wall biosynthesis